MLSREGQCCLAFGHAKATTWIVNATAGSAMQAPWRTMRNRLHNCISRSPAIGSAPRAQKSNVHTLQRLDFHLAKFHYAPVVRDALVVFQPQAMLKRNSAVGKFTVLRAVN